LGSSLERLIFHALFMNAKEVMELGRKFLKESK
jgi:hypothetical protein